MPYTYEPQSLARKNILLTGGTTGIGRSTAYRLVAAGANVLMFGRHEEELNDALEGLAESGLVPAAGTPAGRLTGIVADQSQRSEVERVFREVDSQFGSLDILINNAALAAGSIVDTDFTEWENAVKTNLFGYMYCCRLALDRFKTKGEGHIVNVGSLSAKERNEGSDIYVATKSAIDGFSESLRKKVNDLGIKVTLIEPGLVGTDMTVTKVPAEQQSQAEEKGEMLKAEEIAESIYYTLTQPRRCDVILVQIRPHKEAI